jgi:hypothetical protein
MPASASGTRKRGDDLDILRKKARKSTKVMDPRQKETGTNMNKLPLAKPGTI